ncbi:MAG: T9SS type A sorting domain-containing protein, partial [Hymenobacter sp.]
GSVNAKYLIAFRGIDDEWDTDNGFHGKVQFGVSLRDPAVADQSGSNAFESDNDANGTTNSPQTSAVFSNMSNFIAPTTGTLSTNYKRAMHIRRNSALSVFNSVVAGYPVGLLLDGTLSEQNAAAGRLVLSNNVYAGFTSTSVATVVNSSTYNVSQFLSASNDVASTVASLNLSADNFNLTYPNFVPQSTSPLASGAAFTNAKLTDSFFTPVTYRGAFNPAGDDWTTGWTNFNPQITCYNVAGRTLSAKPVADQSLEMAVYPNPAAGAASLSFALPHAATATVRIVDLLGRPVATVATDRKLAAGPQLLALPTTLAAGIYLATVTTDETTQSVRFVVAK